MKSRMVATGRAQAQAQFEKLYNTEMVMSKNYQEHSRTIYLKHAVSTVIQMNIVTHHPNPSNCL